MIVMMLIDGGNNESVSFRVFVFLQAEGQEVASVVSAQEIRVVAELLQISPDSLQKAVTFKLTVRRTHFTNTCNRCTDLLYSSCRERQQMCLTSQDTVREKIYTPLTVESAVDAR